LRNLSRKCNLQSRTLKLMSLLSLRLVKGKNIILVTSINMVMQSIQFTKYVEYEVELLIVM
jgi:hypothetical protein